MTFPTAGFTLIETPDLAAATQGVLDDLAHLAPGPFDAPVVMVRHAAVRRHLTLALARAQGVAASVDFPAPLQLLHRLQGTPRNDPWSRGALGWRIAAALQALLDQLPSTIARITSDADPFVRIAFSRRLAARLHDAMHHRPALIAAWEQHALALREASDEAWQAELWRMLVANTTTPSPVARHLAWCAGMTSRTEPDANWPTALVVVSDPTLPPLLREALHAMSPLVPVRWHCLVAGAVAFDPERPKRRPAALAALRALPGIAIEHAATRHPTAATATLLGAVQQQLAGTPAAPLSRITDDTSLLAHRAHSAVRELESLREQLAWRLGQDPSLAPHDVTIYLTDLADYLPAVDAVFGTTEPGLPRLPYEVAGRPWRSRSTVGSAVTALFDALAGRFGSREVLALLDHLLVRIAAEIHGAQLLRARHMVAEARIRWGLDGDDRAARHHVPALPDGTWRHGLAQLALSYGLLDGIDDDDPDAVLVQRLTAWIEKLARWRVILETPHPIEEWSSILDAFFTAMVTSGGSDDAAALGELREAVHTVVAQVVAAGSSAPLLFTSLRPTITEALEGVATSGQLRGGLRICRLEAGSVLPARVVMIAGLDDARFPRGGGTPPWDILLQSRLDNDRDPLESEDPDPREDALDAFRDAIRSASDAVHLSWTGRSMMDNALRSPSVAVSEIFEVVDRVVTATAEDSEPHRQIIVDEPLQPFAPRLFGAPGFDGKGRAPLQSAARRWHEAATTVLDEARRLQPFVTAALPEPPPLTRIGIDELARAIANPPEWFWRTTLGLPLPGRNSEEADHEPILPEDLTGLELPDARIKYAAEQFPGVVATLGVDVELPYGNLAIPTVAQREADLAVAVARTAASTSLGLLNARLEIDGVVIEGKLERIGPDGMLVIAPHPVSGGTLLRAWLRHLVLNAVATGESGRTTTVVGVAKEADKLLASFSPVADPRAELAKIVALARRLRRQPVPFFPRAAVAVALAMRDGKPLNEAARGVWQTGHNGSEGEGDSVVVQRLFDGRDLDPQGDPELWAAFIACVEQLVRPMVEHLSVGGAT